MKILSFCLWGNDPMYTIGAIKNAKLAKEIYNDFECRFYVPTGYDTNIIQELKDCGSVVIERTPIEGHVGSMWRFLPCFEKKIELVVSRDVDSRLTEREYNTVNNFINTSYTIQSLKDHQCHSYPELLAGMVAIKPKKMYKNFKKDFDYFMSTGYKQEYSEYAPYGGNYKGCDQIFLSKFVYQNMIYQTLTYSDLCSNKIGELTDKSMFIGNKFDANDNPLYVRGY